MKITKKQNYDMIMKNMCNISVIFGAVNTISVNKSKNKGILWFNYYRKVTKYFVIVALVLQKL